MMSSSSGPPPPHPPSQPREEMQQPQPPPQPKPQLQEEKPDAAPGHQVVPQAPPAQQPQSGAHSHLPATVLPSGAHTQLPAAVSHLPAPIITRTIQHADKVRAAFQPSAIRPSLTGRPIAPAPATSSAVAANPLSNAVQHTVIPRLPKAVQGLAMAAPSALASLQTQQQQIQAAIAPSALQQPVPGAVTPAALAAAHTTVAAGLPGTIQATPMVPMASIIRGPSIPQQVISTAMVTAAHHPQTQTATRTFTTHLPRGISPVVTAAKTATVATAVLRPSHPVSVQLPTGIAGNMLTAGLHQLHRPMTIPAVSAIRPSTPPTTSATRSSSPHMANLQAPQTTEVHSSMLAFHPNLTAHRPILSQHPTSSAPGGTSTVQITIQPPRQPEVTTRPLLSQHAPGTVRPLPIPQTVLQQPQIQTVQSPAHKVVMSHATVAPIIQPSIAAATAVAKINKNVPASVIPMVTSSVNPVSTPTVNIAASITAPVTTAPTIPIAKVHPQRQLPISQSSSQPHEFTRETASIQPGPQGSIFLPQAHRGSPSVTTSSLTGPTVATQLDSRQDRPTISPHVGANAYMPEYYNFVNYVPQIMYHHQMAPASAMASVASGATFRPSHVPSQTPNLAATLQAAAHNISVSTTQGVRINPMMVTVDPSRHPIPLSVHTAYPQPVSTAADAKAAANTAADVLTTMVNSAVFSNSGQTMASAPLPQQPTPQSITGKDPSASPRPSILRKRTNDGTPVTFKKNLSTPTSSERSSPMAEPPLSATSSPKPSNLLDPSRENSQSSTDTATSTENTPSTQSTPEVKVKQEPGDVIENGPSNTPVSAPPPQINHMETSPRKKPRKQLLNATVEDIKDATSTDEEVEKLSKAEVRRHFDKPRRKDKNSNRNKSEAVKFTEMPEVPSSDMTELSEYVDDDGIRWTVERVRPNMALMNHYNCTWKARNNHFLRHTDVKVKDERRPTVNELSNQKGVVQKVSGWRMYHIASQLEEIMDAEREVFSKMSSIQEAIAPKTSTKQIHSMEDDIGMVHELTQGNIQRCQLVIDQLDEAKGSMIKILDHKQRITDIINKHHSKRPVKKKERT